MVATAEILSTPAIPQTFKEAKEKLGHENLGEYTMSMRPHAHRKVFWRERTPGLHRAEGGPQGGVSPPGFLPRKGTISNALRILNCEHAIPGVDTLAFLR